MLNLGIFEQECSKIQENEFCLKTQLSKLKIHWKNIENIFSLNSELKEKLISNKNTINVFFLPKLKKN